MFFPRGSDGKESVCNAGYISPMPRSGRSPKEGNGYPLQYSHLENSMDVGAWQATVHGVAKSGTWLSDYLCTMFNLETPWHWSGPSNGDQKSLLTHFFICPPTDCPSFPSVTLSAPGVGLNALKATYNLFASFHQSFCEVRSFHRVLLGRPRVHLSWKLAFYLPLSLKTWPDFLWNTDQNTLRRRHPKWIPMGPY